jgi:hypothetical protein
MINIGPPGTIYNDLNMSTLEAQIATSLGIYETFLL